MSKQKSRFYSQFEDFGRKYKLEDKEIYYIWRIIKPIFCHDEFQKRMTDPYWHHQDVTIGEHIIGDTIMAYKICCAKQKNEAVIRRTILVAMFHDLYVQSWMIYNPKQHFINSHAFTHPIEAIINAITWFPQFFENVEDAKIIIDGVLHHMYPCPVRAFSDLELEIGNFDLYEALDAKYKKIIICSLNSCMFKNLSLRNSFYVEGRILSKADKIITMKKDLKGAKAVGALKTLVLAVLGRHKTL